MSEGITNEQVSDTTTEIGSADWWNAHRAKEEEAKRKANEEFKAVLKGIRDRGATTIVAEFDGCGDSGTVEDPVAMDNERHTIDLTPEEIEKIVGIVEFNISGDWYNGDGGCGEATFYLDTMLLQIDEKYRYTEYDEATTEVSFGDATEGGAS